MEVVQSARRRLLLGCWLSFGSFLANHVTGYTSEDTEWSPKIRSPKPLENQLFSCPSFLHLRSTTRGVRIDEIRHLGSYRGLTSTPDAELSPPPIPQEALARGTARAAAQAAKARAESERLRLGQEQGTDAILGGETEDEEGDVVAVFGEVVEDPLLFEPLDHCEDPQVVCEEMKRLNHEVLKGFIKLTQNLVHDPAENK